MVSNKILDEINPAHFAKVCSCLAVSNAKTCTMIVSPKHIVRATWRFKPNARNKREEMVVTIGAPNYDEREFINKCKKAGEPFPIKKIQYKFYPKANK